MSKIEQIKTLQAAVAAQAMKLLDWNEQQYAEFQFEQGYEYLKYWIGEDVFGYRELPLEASFWAWWRNHWYKRDMQFADKAPAMSMNERVRYYNHIHSPKGIEYTPQSVIMDDAYAKMIHKVTHGEVGI